MDLVFLIDKSFLTREGWEEGLRMMGRSGSWDRMPNHVIADSTIGTMPPQLIEAAGLPPQPP